MTIAVPLPTNLTPGELEDSTCLGAATELVATMVRERDPALIALAQKHGDIASLIEDLRSRPQRDDEGHPDDGPKVDACDPPQRFQVDNPYPNCFERAAIYIGAAETIDPRPVRRMATAMTPNGLHTFPVEDGEPIVLDPYQSRNALAATLYRATRLRRNGAEPQSMTPWQAIDWIAEIAAEPAARFKNGSQRVRNAHRAVTALLGGRALCVADVRDLAFMLALADRESRLWGPVGPRIVATTAHALDKVDQAAAQRWKTSTCSQPRNAVELRIGDLRLRPDMQLLGSLGRIGGRLGYRAGIEALRVKLASFGVTPPVLNTIEQELNREGISLAALSKPPPMPGSLNALTPEAIAGHWLAGKL